MDAKSFITFDIFKAYPELLCVFTTRKGGLSTGDFASFNMGLKTGESFELVQTNRSLLYKFLNISESQIAYQDQVHSSNLYHVNKPGIYAKTDALICSVRGIFLAIQTADCFPVFLYAKKEELISIIHIGWRGAVMNIIDRTLKSLETDYEVDLSNIIVAVGPGLGMECFEVKRDVYEQFPKKYLGIHPDKEKRYLNLREFIIDNLKDYGIQNSHIHINTACTKCNDQIFYSYRRDGRKSGRMMGIIGMK
jgi:YfiH family protein